MSRSGVALRHAAAHDAPVLQELWQDVLRKADASAQVADLATVIERCNADPDSRLLVAELDGELAGAVMLRISELTPINLERVVQVISPHVLPSFRRRGVGTAFMDAAVAFGEERGVTHVAAAALATSRDSNRFLARLALAPVATLRVAPVTVIRSRLSPRLPIGVASRTRIDKVLAVRRSRRRIEAPAN